MRVAGKNGIGRVDLVENRFIGIKSRGVYETPGGTLLMTAHRAIESVTLDKETMHKKDEIMPKYAELIYNGYWYSKARFKLQKIVDLKKHKVNGEIKLKLYKGNITIVSRQTKSDDNLKNSSLFDDTQSFHRGFSIFANDKLLLNILNVSLLFFLLQSKDSKYLALLKLDAPKDLISFFFLSSFKESINSPIGTLMLSWCRINISILSTSYLSNKIFSSSRISEGLVFSCPIFEIKTISFSSDLDLIHLLSS